MLYSVVIFGLLAAVASAQDEKWMKCRKAIHHDTFKCCTAASQMKHEMPKEFKECFKIAEDPVTCERELCLAKTQGYATADGNLDMAKLIEVVKTDFAEYPEVAESIQNNCVDGDIEPYSAADHCDFVKMRHCSLVQMIKLCPEWNDTGDCKGSKEWVEECTKLFP